MFPYRDDTQSFSPPAWVLILIALNVVLFLMSYTSGPDHYIRTIFAYGTIPARFFQADAQPLQFDQEIRPFMQDSGVDQDDWATPFMTLFTSIFLHGGIFHLVGNMWFLWLFGDNVEDRLGKLMFPIFYIVCGFIAGLIHVLTNQGSTVPAIGASGAIAGVMGAYIYLFPRSTIATLINWGFYFRTTHISAPLFLGIWFILQLFGGFVEGGGSNVAFMAHVGGFVAGLFLAMLLSVLRGITWYPGDRGYTGTNFSSHPSAKSKIPSPGSYTPSRRSKRYVWRD